MKDKVLFVDDEQNVLRSIQRSLRAEYDVTVVDNGKKALEIISTNNDFAVIVSDKEMPNMDGLELLSQAKKIRPDTIRIMLTGMNDQTTAIEAINKGEIFKFLNKPCPKNILI